MAKDKELSDFEKRLAKSKQQFPVPVVNLDDYKEPAAKETATIPFEAYFEILKTKNEAIKEHHKAPMKAFVLQFGKPVDTIENFESILKTY